MFLLFHYCRSECAATAAQATLDEAADAVLASQTPEGEPDNPVTFRFHALAMPHAISTPEMSICAFTQKLIRFVNGMTARGHTVYHYGHERSQVNVTEHITVTNDAALKASYGEDFDWKKNQWSSLSVSDPVYVMFKENAVAEIAKRCQPGDFILPFFANGHRPTVEAALQLCPGLIVVEPGIGFQVHNIWAPFRVFESYNMQARYYEKQGDAAKWYDVVIPNSYDPDEFEFSDKKKDYCLFVARLNTDKGINIAIQLTQEAGCKLYVAGQGSLASLGYTVPPEHVTEVGFISPEERKVLMRDAKVLILPTFYEEPFGGVVVEAMLSGTPVITTDWGAFAETVLHGVTGYRCRTWPQFKWALKNIDKLDPHACRSWAVQNYNISRALDMYEEYFESLAELHKQNKNWYFQRPDMVKYTIPATPGAVIRGL
jgi:glycosyltransferase involved in cell wall biosynthesis